MSGTSRSTDEGTTYTSSPRRRVVNDVWWSRAGVMLTCGFPAASRVTVALSPVISVTAAAGPAGAGAGPATSAAAVGAAEVVVVDTPTTTTRQASIAATRAGSRG